MLHLHQRRRFKALEKLSPEQQGPNMRNYHLFATYHTSRKLQAVPHKTYITVRTLC